MSNRIVESNVDQTLILLGLNVKQIKIYKTLLRKPGLSVLQISRETGINRASVYRALEEIIKKGLIKPLYEEKKSYFSAQDPEFLKMIYNTEQQKLSKVKSCLQTTIMKLQSSMSQSSCSSLAHLYRGVEGIKQVIWNCTKSKNKKIYQLGYLDWKLILGADYASLIHRELFNRKIYSFELSNTIEDGTLWSQYPEEMKEIHKERYISPKVLEIKHDIYLYDDIVVFSHFLNEDYMAIEIHNDQMFHLQKQMFDHFWNIGEDMPLFEKFVPEG
ncbi:winged helix-turn-helix transcriptional regulator [Candidatus Dojkabacteria bacterium]|nr:winged helix-turn-helix transcriptional regulator [Candidatus Dojkabacteria bacterium]